ncbi:rRNA-processing protein Ebp2p [Trichomonascus vanleenenianus]|uniref:EBP2 family rRNA-processing protein n=1 Tax=Trichomonascus vanleenenianus TaxID=2268995 RepID=UPI003ECB347A
MAGATLKESIKKFKKKVLPKEEKPVEALSHKEKRRLKKEASKADLESEDEENEEEDEEFDPSKLDESSEDEDEDQELYNGESDEEEEEEEEEEEDIPLSDVELDDDADVIPHQKTTINNVAALKQSLSSIRLPHNKIPFHEHMSIQAEEPIVLKDIYDDIERELAFYKQGLEAAKKARKQLKKEDIAFTRPVDYFAEMVKSDEHMDKLKQKLIEDESAKKASQEAKKQRELKKFGKKVQHARLQERAKEKRDTMDKLKNLKRKRGDNNMTSEDFDIAVEEAASFGAGIKKEKGAKRKAKDAKYGSGGKKRFKKSNDAASSADLSGFNQKKMKSNPKQRPGKSKRRH